MELISSSRKVVPAEEPRGRGRGVPLESGAVPGEGNVEDDQSTATTTGHGSSARVGLLSAGNGRSPGGCLDPGTDPSPETGPRRKTLSPGVYRYAVPGPWTNTRALVPPVPTPSSEQGPEALFEGPPPSHSRPSISSSGVFYPPVPASPVKH